MLLRLAEFLNGEAGTSCGAVLRRMKLHDWKLNAVLQGDVLPLLFGVSKSGECLRRFPVSEISFSSIALSQPVLDSLAHMLHLPDLGLSCLTSSNNCISLQSLELDNVEFHREFDARRFVSILRNSRLRSLMISDVFFFDSAREFGEVLQSVCSLEFVFDVFSGMFCRLLA